MSGVINVNGKTAIRVNGHVCLEKGTSALVDIDGDKVWLPVSTFRVNARDKSIDIQEWIFNQKFPKG